MWKRLRAGATVALVSLLAPGAVGAAEPKRDETVESPATEASAKPPAGIAEPAPDPRTLALGRHLARDCASCHRPDGVERGIPKIAGLSAHQMEAALDAYRTGERSNPVMGSVAKTLAPEQVKALITYYAGVKRP